MIGPRRLRLRAAAGLVAGIAAAVLPFAAAAQRPPLASDLDPAAGQLPPQLKEVGFDQRLGERIPLDLVFRDHTGAAVRLGDFFGARPVVLSLVYYDCPMLCPMSMAGLASSLKGVALNGGLDLGRDFEVVTVSFNPAETAADAAKARATSLERYGHEAEGWHFLTGGAAEIRRLTEAVGFRYRFDADRGQYAHAAGIVVATAEGEIARYLFGIEYPPKDLRLALVEAGEGTVGTPVDQVLLYCFHYDPATGKYTIATLRLLRAAAAATVLALGGFIVVMRRRETRKSGESA